MRIDMNVTLPTDVLRAMEIGNVQPISMPDLESEALAAGITPDGLHGINEAAVLHVRMILTNDEPWWQILLAGNPVMAEDKLRAAGYPDAFAGAPGKLWLRKATPSERATYEKETDNE